MGSGQNGLVVALVVLSFQMTLPWLAGWLTDWHCGTQCGNCAAQCCNCYSMWQMRYPMWQLVLYLIAAVVPNVATVRR